NTLPNARWTTLSDSTGCTTSLSQTGSMKNSCATANGAIIFFQTWTGATMFESRIVDCGLRIAAVWLAIGIAAAQESPSPIASATPEESPAPVQTPSASPARSVRVSFVPPPLEGTISLGIYDMTGKLVRVLHQEAQLNEFTIGADALVAQWDGKSDDGEDLPAGKYRARGYLVSALKVEDLGQVAVSPPQDSPAASVRVKLMPNPLANNKRPTIHIAAGFKNDGSYLKT